MTNLEIIAEARTLLADVPAESWLKKIYTNGVDKCCGLGHYTRLKSDDPTDYGLFNCIGGGGLFDACLDLGVNISRVNDRSIDPKSAVLAALDGILSTQSREK